MTEKQILKQAIIKAQENGYHPPVKYDAEKALDFNTPEPWIVLELPYFMIFSHSFAKAFWNKDTIISKETAIERGNAGLSLNPIQTWKDHLQIMVLKENPILYLKQFLK